MNVVQDLTARLTFLASETERELAKHGQRAIAQASSNGTLGNGRLPIAIVESANPLLDEMLHKMLGSLDTALEREPAAEPELVGTFNSVLGAVYGRLPASLGLRRFESAGRTPAFVVAEAERLRERAVELLSHHLAGFEVRPVSAEAVRNQITMHSSTAVIQQGGSRNSQHVTAELDWAAVRDAVAALEQAVGSSGLAEDVRDGLEPDLDSIKAQLRKPSPGAVIVREAALSLRTISEGAIGGALVAAPTVMQHLNLLYRAIGLG